MGNQDPAEGRKPLWDRRFPILGQPPRRFPSTGSTSKAVSHTGSTSKAVSHTGSTSKAVSHTGSTSKAVSHTGSTSKAVSHTGSTAFPTDPTASRGPWRAWLKRFDDAESSAAFDDRQEEGTTAARRLDNDLLCEVGLGLVADEAEHQIDDPSTGEDSPCSPSGSGVHFGIGLGTSRRASCRALLIGWLR